MSTTLFLDFDGVTHRDGLSSESEKTFSQLPVIEGVLRSFPAVSIVLSTSWREFFPMTKCLAKFSADMKARVIGETPLRPAILDMPDELWGYARHMEVHAWLRANTEPYDNWVALEDQPWRYMPFCPNVILTNPKTGFTDEDAVNLTKRLVAFGERRV